MFLTDLPPTPDFATEFADKIKREMERLPADTDLMALATERMIDLSKTNGDLEQMVFITVRGNNHRSWNNMGNFGP